MQGAKEEGFSGFAKGVASGVTGIVTKPTAGMFGLLSDVTEGVANKFVKNRRMTRIRYPRFIGRDHVLFFKIYSVSVVSFNIKLS